MRLTTPIIAALLATLACSGSEPGDAPPPFLPKTGWYEPVEQEWLEQTRILPSFLGRPAIERRAAHFAMSWGGLDAFETGNCRVSQELLVDCGTSTFGDDDEERSFTNTSTVTGTLIDEETLELEQHVLSVCTGDGCWSDDGYEGVERALLVYVGGW